MVTFPSMNAYIADGVGCTPYSFSGEVGVYYAALAEGEPKDWPRDYDLHFRGVIGKTVRQPIFHPWATSASEVEEWQRDRPDVWYVLPDGSNLDEVVDDARASLMAIGLPFIDSVSDPASAVAILRTQPMADAQFGSLGLMLGGIGSPRRLGYISQLQALTR